MLKWKYLKCQMNKTLVKLIVPFHFTILIWLLENILYMLPASYFYWVLYKVTCFLMSWAHLLWTLLDYLEHTTAFYSSVYLHMILLLFGLPFLSFYSLRIHNNSSLLNSG